jgi:hypothetical protein
MLIVLMVAGIGALLAGLLAIVEGILLDLSFGNSLVVAGTIGVCTGLILLALCVVLTELKTIARQLGDPRKAPDGRVRAALPQFAPGAAPAPAAVADDGYLFSQDHVAMGGAIQAALEAAPQAPPPPWHEEAAARGPIEAPPEPTAAPPAPPTKPRRNLLFSSSLRKDRDRAAARIESPIGSDPEVAPAAPPPPIEAAESPATFDDAWPKPERPTDRDRAPDRSPERPRAAEALSQRRSARASAPGATNGSAAAERQPASMRAEQTPAVTVLKSGVVDGMAYSLYSDGSIEAQMPEGMMRFASIDELRAHLDQRQ